MGSIVLTGLAAVALSSPLATARQSGEPDTGLEAGSAPIPVLVVSGQNNHDWRWTSPSLARILEETGRFDVTITYDPKTDLADREALDRYRAFVLDYNGDGWGDAAQEAFLDAVRSGTGVVVVHAADNSGRSWPEYERLVGDLWRDGTGHGAFHAFDVKVVDRDHPVTRTLPTMLLHPDELYHDLVNVHGVDRRVLATAFSDPETGGTGEDEPMILARSYGEGRVFHTPLGHVWTNRPGSQASHNDPQFRGLIVRGTEWAATGEVHDGRTAPKPLTEGERNDGWRSLMDRDAWMSFGGGGAPPGWTFDGDTVHRAASAGDIVTRDLFESFELVWQWKTTIAGNSGVKYRVPEDAKNPIGPEFQLLDAASDVQRAEHRAGALYDVVPAEDPDAGSDVPWGEFHTARILAKGPVLEHWLDGELVMRTDTSTEAWASALADSKFKDRLAFARPAPGRVLLQDHGDEVWIRGMRIRSLEVDEGDPGSNDERLQPLIGDELASDAWRRVGDAIYEVDGDTLVGRAGPKRKQSFLATEEEFHDFELVTGVQIAVLGNSGIQLRSHIREDGRLYGYQAEIDPTDRRWSGGIYDEGRRGWLDDLAGDEAARAAFDLEGENEYRIVCEGPRVRVWVNGIETADLLDSADLSGRIAFQVHGGDDDIVMRWRAPRVRRTGAHRWRSIGDESLPTLFFEGAPGVRASVLGEGAVATIEFEDGTESESVPLSDTEYWHDGGHNRVHALRADERTVVQVGGRTVFESSGRRAMRVRFAGHVSIEDAERCVSVR